MPQQPTTLVLGAPEWLPVAAAAAAVLLALMAWGYRRAGGNRGVRAAAFGLKAVGVLVLAACLLDPLVTGTRARPGANAIALLADDSRSMTLRDADGRQSRAAVVRAVTDPAAAWVARLRRDFDVRAFAFAGQLRAVGDGEALPLDGPASNLAAALDRLARQYQGRPLAGVVLFTDGSATDAAAVDRLLAAHAAAAAAGGGPGRLPRVYPVPLGSPDPAGDVGVARTAVTQTNFEDAPVTVAADLTAAGRYAGRPLVAQLLDEAGKVVQEQAVSAAAGAAGPAGAGGGGPATVRFRVRPEKPGVSFYRVRAAGVGEAGQFDSPDAEAATAEATLANNARTVAVDRGRGPYRVLYVAGRPNWEFKFLQRAVAADDQIRLAGLLRIAKREPKFAFIGRAGEQSNPLFRGFGGANAAQDTGEYDKPVLTRVGTTDEAELRGGFPRTAAELNAYHAVVLDDIEAEFFTPDQLLLLKEFVRARGGGLLMLGGQESFRNGRYDRTPVGDVLPVYADDAGGRERADAAAAAAANAGGFGPGVPDPRYKLSLTREGWLEPWVRLRPDEAGEQQRLATGTPFQTLNRVRGIKPGATVLARAATGDDGPAAPALVEQRFGKGRAAALLVGDLWKWGLGRPADAPADLEKAWRQTVRWLVSEVPNRVEVSVERPGDGAAAGASPAAGSAAAGGTAAGGTNAPDAGIALAVQVRDPAYAPLDAAVVTVRVTGPDGAGVDLPAEPDAARPGRYVATYVPRAAGAYRAAVTAVGPDGVEAGRAEAGWASDPAADEFRDLKPNRDLLARLAAATGGRVVEPTALDAFAAALPTDQAMIADPYAEPAWHAPWVFALAIGCLAAEWGLRRWKGLP